MLNEKGRNHISGNEAIELWKNGPAAWNQWIESVNNPRIEFIDVTFEPNVQEPDGEKLISFIGYKFPKNHTTFRNVVFRYGHLNFSSIDSQESTLIFENCTIDCKRISINNSNLQMISFNKISNNDCHFHIANSRIKDIRIFNSELSNGFLQILGITMDGFNVDFRSNSLNNCNISLVNSDITNGIVRFSNSNFKGGSLLAENIKCLNSTFDITKNDFSCPLEFKNITGAESLSFQGSIFNGFVNLENLKINSVIDLTGTKLSNSIVLHNIKNKLNRKRVIEHLFLKAATNKHDHFRFRRLKEISEQSKNFELALHYFSNERKCQRWINLGFCNSLIDIIYSATSNYGQSVIRPLALWLINMPLFALIYFKLIENNVTCEFKFIDALTISLKNSIPFLNLSKSPIADDVYKILQPDIYITLTSISQGMLSIILTFLIGLGLRNNFRI